MGTSSIDWKNQCSVDSKEDEDAIPMMMATVLSELKHNSMSPIPTVPKKAKINSVAFHIHLGNIIWFTENCKKCATSRDIRARE